jgi:hypothetical protein
MRQQPSDPREHPVQLSAPGCDVAAAGELVGVQRITAVDQIALMATTTPRALSSGTPAARKASKTQAPCRFLVTSSEPPERAGTGEISMWVKEGGSSHGARRCPKGTYRCKLT